MGKWAVVDFSGYFYDDKFIIKEFCSYIPVGNEIKSHTCVTVPPIPNISDISPKNLRSYRVFHRRTGIKWSAGKCTISSLEIILDELLTDHIVYVRNDLKREQLENFVGSGYFHQIRLAEDFGFYEEKVAFMEVCSIHSGRELKYYCAGSHAKSIADWNVNRQLIKSFVIDFNGYCLYNNKFLLKEISIFGLDRRGQIVYHNFFVADHSATNRSQNIKEVCQETYYRKYGIKWEDGSEIAERLQQMIGNIFKCTSNLERVLVKSELHSDQLKKIIDKPYKVICVNELGYKENLEDEPLRTDCSYHTRKGTNMNLCADVSAKKMTKWVQKMKYFDDENIHSRALVNALRNREFTGSNKDIPFLKSVYKDEWEKICGEMEECHRPF